MPVRKYRSAEEMPGVAPRTPLDPDNVRVACELSELARALRPRRLQPGLRKFRSAEELEGHPPEIAPGEPRDR